VSADPGRAASSWRKAEAHCREALAQDADASPMAIIHSSYYAMFHAARAVLFQVTGSDLSAHHRTRPSFGHFREEVTGSRMAHHFASILEQYFLNRVPMVCHKPSDRSNHSTDNHSLYLV
jgi:uncharacterized protein (UPF0332 family)